MLKTVFIRVGLSSRSDPDPVEEGRNLASVDQDLGEEAVAGDFRRKGRRSNLDSGQFMRIFFISRAFSTLINICKLCFCN